MEMTTIQKGGFMTTRKGIRGMWAIALFLGAFAIFGGIKEAAGSGVSINLNLGMPQEVIMGPSGVYFVPNQGIDVFFYGGYWWAMRDDHWYRSHDYDGDWREMDRRYIPGPVYRTYSVPNYRDVYGRQDGHHIPYGQWKKEGHRGGSGDQGNRGSGDHGNRDGRGGGGGGNHGHGN